MRQQQQQRMPSPAEHYEMRVRSPSEQQWAAYPEPGSARGIHTPMATEDSYMTARDDYEGYEGYDNHAPQSASQHQHQQEESWRSSTYSYSGPHAL